VNTVTASFNTIMGQMTEMSQRQQTDVEEAASIFQVIKVVSKMYQKG